MVLWHVTHCQLLQLPTFQGAHSVCEILKTIYHSTWCNIHKDLNLYQHLCENLTSCTVLCSCNEPPCETAILTKVEMQVMPATVKN